MSADRNFIFTVTPGHTGTTWLSEFLGENLPASQVFHELLGYDRFGVDTPDISHLTLFNSQGNIPRVEAFWQQKSTRILAQDCVWYGETSHLLAKCGLLENIHQFTRAGTVHVICLERDLLALVRSMRRRGDMLNKGDQWLWHLDPDYPRKLVSAEFFRPYGHDGLRLWYACEMRARAAYYRQMLAAVQGLRFISTSLEALVTAAGQSLLLQQLGVGAGREQVVVPGRSNASMADAGVDDEPIAKVIREMHFDPEEIAARYLAAGYRLGVPVPAGRDES